MFLHFFFKLYNNNNIAFNGGFEIKRLKEYANVPTHFDYPLNFEDFNTISGLKIWFPWVHFFACLPEIFFSFGLLFLLIYISFNDFAYRLERVYSFVIVLLFVVFCVQLINPYASPLAFNHFDVFLRFNFLYEWPAYFIFYKNFIIDYYSVVLRLIILIFSIFLLTVFKYYVRFSLLLEYPILISFLILGLLLLVQSFDLITMYLSLELIALTSYVLAAFAKKSIESLEAGIKYLILGSVASGFILFGVSLLYGVTSYVDFYHLKLYFTQVSSLYTFINTETGDAASFFFLRLVLQPLLPVGEVAQLYSGYFGFWDHFENLNLGILVGSLFINLGFLAKLSAAPFHMWTPDVYEGSPLSTTVLFLTVVKIGILGFYLRLVYFLFYDFFYIYVQPLLVFCGVLSIVWGSLAGLGQYRLKRLFAYSAIVNTGFILLGLSEGSVECSTYAVFLYCCFYFLTNFIIFFFFFVTRSSVSGESFDFYTDLRGYGVSNPIWGVSFAVCLFSLAGIPPFVGFWGKLSIFVALISLDFYNWSLPLIVIGSVVSSFYYLRLIKIMFFDSSVYVNTFTTFFVKPYLFFVYWFCFGLLFFFTVTPIFFEQLLDFRLLEFSLFGMRFQYILEYLGQS